MKKEGRKGEGTVKWSNLSIQLFVHLATRLEAKEMATLMKGFFANIACSKFKIWKTVWIIEHTVFGHFLHLILDEFRTFTHRLGSPSMWRGWTLSIGVCMFTEIQARTKRCWGTAQWIQWIRSVFQILWIKTSLYISLFTFTSLYLHLHLSICISLFVSLFTSLFSQCISLFHSLSFGYRQTLIPRQQTFSRHA